MMTSGEPIICGCGLRAGQTCSQQPCLRVYWSALSPKVTVTPWPSLHTVGCICPPGSNKDCESPVCPRKPHRNVTSSGGSTSV
jgi:hypothetical protein